MSLSQRATGGDGWRLAARAGRLGSAVAFVASGLIVLLAASPAVAAGAGTAATVAARQATLSGTSLLGSFTSSGFRCSPVGFVYQSSGQVSPPAAPVSSTYSPATFTQQGGAAAAFGGRFSITTSAGTTVNGFASGPLNGGCSRGGSTNVFSAGGRPSAGYVATITTADGRRFSDVGFAFASFVGQAPQEQNLAGSSRLSFVSQLTEAQPIPSGAHLTLGETASTPSGDAPLAETYTYTLRNDGSDPMFQASLSSDGCTPVTYQSGDGNGDTLLQPGEDWTFSCSRTYTAAGTYTDHTTAGATSTQTGLPTTSNTTVATVRAGSQPYSTTAHVQLSERAEPASGPTPLAVTFTTTLVNDGLETLSVALGAPTSDPCSPLSYQSGDTNGDALLEPGETWAYTCSRTYSADGTYAEQVQAGGTSIQTGLSIDSNLAQATVDAVAPAPTAPTLTASRPPPTATAGTAYSYTFAATGNPSPTFSVATGTLPAGLGLSPTGTLSGTPTTSGPSTFTVRATNGVGPDATSSPISIAVTAPSNGSGFAPLSPFRVWDSRSGPGPAGRIGARGTRNITVAGVGSVPSDVTAVVLNVTAVNPSAATFVTAWPTGEAQPLASNLNVPAGDTRPNLVIVKVGAGGGVSFSNDNGDVDLIADVEGYYGPAAGQRFTGVSPSRVWDSRSGPGPSGRIGPAETRDVTVTGTGGVPAAGVTAVVLNVTASSRSAATYVTAWPTGEVQPLASTLNVPAGDTRPNLVIVKVGTGGKISFSNANGSLDLIADIAGYFSTAGSAYTSISPSRVWDSRSGPGPTGRIGAGQTREITVTGTNGVPATGVTAVVLNVTAANPSAGTYVTAWPTGEAQPLASNLNVPAGDTRPNLVVVKVGAGGKVSFSNDDGSVDLIADIAGYH